jgi:hypothetical protein
VTGVSEGDVREVLAHPVQAQALQRSGLFDHLVGADEKW